MGGCGSCCCVRRSCWVRRDAKVGSLACNSKACAGTVISELGRTSETSGELVGSLLEVAFLCLALFPHTSAMLFWSSQALF